MGFVYLEVRLLVYFSVLGWAVYGLCEMNATKSSEYVVDYTVESRPISGLMGCQRVSDVQTESSLPPGKPRITGATLEGSALTVKWSPPNDGSVQFLTGFLVEIWVETEDYAPAGPSACYTVQLADVAEKAPLQYSEICLSCTVARDDNCVPVDLDFFVTSFPHPDRPSLKEDKVTVGTSGSNCSHSTNFVTKRSTIPVSVTCATTVSPNEDLQGRNTDTNGNNTLVPMVAIISGVLSVMVTVAIVFILYRKRKCQESSETAEHSKETFIPTSSPVNNLTSNQESSDNKPVDRVVFSPETDLEKQISIEQATCLKSDHVQSPADQANHVQTPADHATHVQTPAGHATHVQTPGDHAPRHVDSNREHFRNKYASAMHVRHPQRDHWHDRDSLHTLNDHARIPSNKNWHERPLLNEAAFQSGTKHFQTFYHYEKPQITLNKNDTIFQEQNYARKSSSSLPSNNGPMTFPVAFRKFALETNQDENDV